MALRVLYLSPYTGGGGAAALRNYVTLLDGRDVEPSFVFRAPCDFSHEMQDRGWQVAFDEALRTVPRSANPAILARHAARSAGCVRRLVRNIRDRGIQIVHQGCEATLVGGVAARVAGIPAGVQVVGMSIFSPRPVAFTWCQLLRRAFSIVYCAQDPIVEALERFHVPSSRLLLLYNSVDTAAIRGAAGRSKPWAEGPLRVGMVASADARKGAHHLVEAAARISRARDDVHFHIIGTGRRDNDYAANLANRVDELGLSDRVHFEGYVSDVPVRLSALDVMVQPSESEALALAQLEGMALERPLVVSDVGGNTVAVEHGVTGLVVPPRNPAALADAILRLLDDPDLRRAMGSAGRVRVEHLFDSRHNVGRLINSYHRLVS